MGCNRQAFGYTDVRIESGSHCENGTIGCTTSRLSVNEENPVEPNPHAAAVKAILALMFVNTRLLNTLAAQGLIAPDEVLSIWNSIRFGVDEQCFRSAWDQAAVDLRNLHSLYAQALRLAKDNWKG